MWMKNILSCETSSGYILRNRTGINTTQLEVGRDKQIVPDLISEFYAYIECLNWLMFFYLQTVLPRTFCKTGDMSSYGLTVMKRRCLPCLHECEVFGDGPEAEESRLAWETCGKTQNKHGNFIPIQIFSEDHLPGRFRNSCLLEFITLMAKLTVRLRVSHVSAARPDDYAFASHKGKNVSFTGSGWVFKISLGEGPCPCQDCHWWQPRRLHCSWWRCVVLTACHVVYDKKEAKKTKVDLFYDSDKSLEYNQVKTLYGYDVEDNNQRDDVCLLQCATHDEDLVNTLKRFIASYKCQKWEVSESIMSTLCVVISHPHGEPKKVTVGEISSMADFDPETSYLTEYMYTYTAETCRGSSGAPVMCAMSRKQLGSEGVWPGAGPHSFGHVNGTTHNQCGPGIFYIEADLLDETLRLDGMKNLPMRAGLITQGVQATVRVHKLCLKWVKMWIYLFRWGQFMNECTNVGNYRLKSYAQMSCTHVKDSIDTKYKQKTATEPADFTFFLIGNSGIAKSCVGNAILKRTEFPTEVKETRYATSEFIGKTLKVVDMIGLDITQSRMLKGERTDRFLKQMNEAMSLAAGGDYAFLLVLNCEAFLTLEDDDMMHLLYKIFGAGFVHDKCILVMANGGHFENERSDVGEEVKFDDWCQRQGGRLRVLWEDCECRALLFDKTSRKKQTQDRQIEILLYMCNEMQSKQCRSMDLVLNSRDQTSIAEKKINQDRKFIVGEVNRNKSDLQYLKMLFIRAKSLKIFVRGDDKHSLSLTYLNSDIFKLFKTIEDAVHFLCTRRRLNNRLKGFFAELLDDILLQRSSIRYNSGNPFPTIFFNVAPFFFFIVIREFLTTIVISGDRI
ncbi:immune-associated nucleotide-binding protein 13 [Plakobranchus ocellatus]|uniref:Immune-associated nucleotide-binding protein 13 n=1 Tax=Plakobranchus ocellatus TaxID=259542 RepID=A0AAV4DP95_9GAST|nr:immune-associated nucleotide-binding protein 13 [Plakobranchus ocellatus]